MSGDAKRRTPEMTPFALGMLRNHGITFNSVSEYQRWQADAERIVREYEINQGEHHVE